MTTANEYETSLGAADPKRIYLLGKDLADDMMGKVGFGELALWLMTQEKPTPAQTRLFEAVLVALADHGFTPTAIAARITFLSAPDSVQGAIAAGLLGGGSRYLGVTEDAGAYLHDVLARHGRTPATPEEYDQLATQAVQESKDRGEFVPGLGHGTHKEGDPRTPALMNLAEQEGIKGPHLQLFDAIGRVHEPILGKHLPLNGAGVCGAALLDIGCPMPLLRGVSLIARCAGLVGQLAEEHRRPVAQKMVNALNRDVKYVNPGQ